MADHSLEEPSTVGLYTRVVRGAEAGAITAGAVETFYFVLDVVRFRPLETPATLSGAGVSPGGLSVDLSSVSGWIDAAFAGYQLSVLTATHFAAFALAGVVASLAFDWSRSGGIGRFGMLAVLCAIALLGTVALSSSLVVLGSIGGWAVLGMIVSAPAILGAILRVLSTPEEERPG